METISAALLGLAQSAGGRPLVTVDGHELGWAEFARQVRHLAARLAAQLDGQPQPVRVALVLPNSVHWYPLFYAISSVGAIPVPLDPQIGAWEIERVFGLLEIGLAFVAESYKRNPILEQVRAYAQTHTGLRRIVVVEPSSAGLTGNFPAQSVCTLMDFLSGPTGELPNDWPSPLAAESVLMLATTSGTTGNPKILEVPHRGFRKAQQDMADYLGFRASDRMLVGMPLYHQGGFGMGLQMALAGGSLYYQSLFDPREFLRLVETERISVLQLTATLAKILLSTPGFADFDLGSLRMVYFAGERLPAELAAEFSGRLGLRVINVIGSSETATMVVYDSAVPGETDSNVFRRLPFTQIRLVDATGDAVAVGEIGALLVHTDALILGYFGNQAETALRLSTVDGQSWFNTGDLGRKIDADHIEFTGRSKRIIKRGANLIHPEEVEAFFLTHPDIAAIAVCGQPHEVMGEMLIAHIQPKPGALISQADLMGFARGRIAAYKIPDRLNITPQIPLDIGKVQFKYLDQSGGRA